MQITPLYFQLLPSDIMAYVCACMDVKTPQSNLFTLVVPENQNFLKQKWIQLKGHSISTIGLTKPEFSALVKVYGESLKYLGIALPQPAIPEIELTVSDKDSAYDQTTEQKIASLTHLKKLSYERQSWLNDGTCNYLNSFSSLSNLTELSLAKLAILEEANFISSLTSLTKLALVDLYNLNNFDFLARLAQLRFFKLSSNSGFCRQFNLDPLLQLDQLQKVRIKRVFINADFLNRFSQKSTLTSLNLGSSNLINNSVEKLSQFVSLTSLNLLEAGFHYAMGYLTTLTRLKKLNILRNSLSSSEISPIIQLTTLESLNLSSNPIIETGVRKLTALTNLRTLRIGGVTINDPACFEHFTALSRLECLDISQNNIAQSHLSHLSRLPHLTMVTIRDWGFNVNDISLLATMTHLIYLNAENTNRTASLKELIDPSHFPEGAVLKL